MNRRILLFAERNMKEILRDPINLFFGLGFPIILLFILSVVNGSIPPEAGNTMFAIDNLAPGLAIFGTAFMALFSGMLLAKDRGSSFLMRLFTSPTTSKDFLFGYTLPMLVVAIIQSLITFLTATLFGFSFTSNVLLAVLVIVPITLLFVAIGLLCGSIMSDKAVGGICGALLTNIVGWFSGVFMPLDLIGGTFKTLADIMPFSHGVKAIKAILVGDLNEVLPHITVVLLYTVAIYLLSIIIFNKKMR